MHIYIVEPGLELSSDHKPATYFTQMLFDLILTNKIKVEANQVTVEYINSSGQMDSDQLCLNKNQKLTFFYQMVPQQNPAPHILLLFFFFFFPFSEHSDVQIQSITGVSDRSGMVVLVQRVMALPLFWNHVGVILVDTIFYLQ